MIVPSRFVGIDVSKATLDIFDEQVGSPERIDNQKTDIARRARRWKKEDTLVVFEASGPYIVVLCQTLAKAGVRHAVVEPGRVRAYARAKGRLAKTDVIDARLIAEYGRVMEPREQGPVDAAREALKSLSNRRDQLVDMRAQEKNRFGETHDPVMRKSAARHIEFLTREIDALDQAIADRIAADEGLREDEALLRSAPGVGPVASTLLLAQMPELGAIGPKPAAALVGLAPFNADSGTFRGKRMIKGGRWRLRKGLYMAALNCVRREGPVRDFYLKLREAGKPAKLALVAAARKLLVILNAMIRDRKPFMVMPAT